VALSVADFDFVRGLVREQAGIVLDTRQYLVESRLTSLARREGFASSEELVAKLRGRRHGGLTRKVVEAMTTHETAFFRDLHPFEVLRTTVLPRVLSRRLLERKLAIWCAACSTGQEPYSVAMLLREHFPSLAKWDVSLIASDLSERVLSRAREGRFTQLEVNRGLSPHLVSKYFEQDEAGHRIRADVRAMVDFREVNLLAKWPPMPRLDVVILRNVLIYFDADTKRSILSRLSGVLEPDGYLFLGGAETTVYLDDSFIRMPFERAGCYRFRSFVEEEEARHA
jgi:chemotaxis protein methyltransferase CheR